jgi:hypothetical protein
MEHLTLEKIILLLLGMAIGMLTALSTFAKADKTFRIGIFLEQNILSGAMSFLMGFASLIMTDTFFHFLGVEVIPHGLALGHAFVSGLLPQLMLDRIKKAFL